jgi:hypothetical protein
MEWLTHNWGALSALLAAGAAFGGVKVGLNGTRDRVRNLERGFLEHAKLLQKHVDKEDSDRIVMLQQISDVKAASSANSAKLDLLVKGMIRHEQT